MNFRPIIYSDFKYLYKLVGNLWCFTEFCHDAKNARFFTSVAVTEVFATTNFSLVATINGKPSGFLLANIGNIPTNNKHAARFNRVSKKLYTLSNTENQGITEYLRLTKAFNNLKHQIPTDKHVAQIIFFATTPSARGTGVGSALMRKFTKVCEEKGIKVQYLLTDEQCTYQYYDRHGFHKVAKIPEKITLNGKTISNNIFLYTKKI